MSRLVLKLPKQFITKVRPENVFSDLTSGLVVGFTQVIIVVSLGNLVFSGSMAPYSSLGVSLSLFSAGLIELTLAVLSGMSGTVGNMQDSVAAILAATVTSLSATLVAATPQVQLATVLVMIVLCSLLTGIMFLLLGIFKLGKLVRFIPYPIVGGFLAGTGGLLILGGLGVMGGTSITLQTLPNFFLSHPLFQWIPGVIFAFTLFFVLQRFRHFLMMPAVVLGAIVIFYLMLLVGGISMGQAQTLGLVASQSTQGFTWQPFNPALILQADWQAILMETPHIIAVLLVGTLHILLNTSSLELAWAEDVDLNRELKAAGIGNLLVALGGGMVGYHSLGLSALSRRVGAKWRLAAITSGSVCLFMLVAGAALISYFPRFLLGGLLVFLGIGFLHEWLIRGRLKMPLTDYLIMILITAVIIASGFLLGVGVGLVLTVVLFVIDYSRINVVHHALSGVERTSNVIRPTFHRGLLSELGDQIYILELRGYVFFGTANSLLEQIKQYFAQSPARYVVLDFRRVTGLDASAILSFSRIKQFVESKSSYLILCHMTDELRQQLTYGGLSADSASIRVFDDLDRGLEWCEDKILSNEHTSKIIVPTILSLQLRQTKFDKDKIHHFLKYLERCVVEQNEYLVHQGDTSTDLYFIEAGRVSIYHESDNGERVRLRTLDMGTMVGELGLFLKQPRTASVITDGPVIAYRLTREALDKMKVEQPEIATAFHEYLTRILATRLVATDRLVEALSD